MEEKMKDIIKIAELQSNCEVGAEYGAEYSDVTEMIKLLKNNGYIIVNDHEVNSLRNIYHICVE